MCNLYDIGRPRTKARDDWDEALAKALRETEAALSKKSGIRKTDPGLVVVRDDSGGLRGSVMRWGFARTFNPAVNNARSDKLDEMWSEAWRSRRRCLIPISAYYEWTGSAGKKQTYAFRDGHDPDRALWAAGLWEEGEQGAAFSMITTTSAGPAKEIHDRMPVLLPTEARMEFIEDPDPRGLLVSCESPLEIFRCLNPLKNPAEHAGPVPDDFLPGF